MMKKISNIFISERNKKTMTWVMTLIILLVVGISFLHLSYASKPVCSIHKDAVMMNSHNNGLSQTWESDVKNSDGVILYIDSDKSSELTGDLVVSLLKDKRVLRTEKVDLKKISGQDTLSIKWKKVSMNLGEQYVLNIRLENIKKNTSLVLKCNKDYWGLTDSNGNHIQGALAADFIFSKSCNVLWFIKVLIIFGSVAGMLALLADRHIEETIGMAVCIIYIWLYIFGIFGELTWGITLLEIICSLLAVMLPMYMYKKKRNIASVITPAVIMYVFMMLMYFIIDRNLVCGKIDELSQWQYSIRDMWYSGAYSCHPGSVVEFKRYTPGMSTIEYLFLYLYGDYREGIIMFACHTIGFAFMSILFSGITYKNGYKVIPVAMAIISLPTLCYPSHYAIIYVDAYLGIVGAYLVISYFTSMKKDLFSIVQISSGMLFLAMIKEMGLIIALTLSLIIFVDMFVSYGKKKWNVFVHLKIVKQYFISVLFFVMMYLTWDVYLGINGQMNSFSTVIYYVKSRLSALGRNGTLVATSTQKSLETSSVAITPKIIIRSMAAYLLKANDYLGMPYLSMMVIIILFCIILYKCNITERMHIRMKALIYTLIVVNVIYTAFLCFCYLYLFGDSGQTAIPAVRRYMATCMLLFIAAISGAIIVGSNKAESEYGWKQQLTWIIGIILTVRTIGYSSLYTTEGSLADYNKTWIAHREIGEVFRSFADKNERVYYVSYDKESAYNYLSVANAICPMSAQGLNSGWIPLKEQQNDYPQFNVIVSQKELRNILENYDYVYLYDVDDYFKKEYGDLFENKQDMENGGIYKVTNKDQRIKLAEIAFKKLN